VDFCAERRVALSWLPTHKKEALAFADGVIHCAAHCRADLACRAAIGHKRHMAGIGFARGNHPIPSSRALPKMILSHAEWHQVFDNFEESSSFFIDDDYLNRLWL
jgi:hypothetical protein